MLKKIIAVCVLMTSLAGCSRNSSSDRKSKEVFIHHLSYAYGTAKLLCSMPDSQLSSVSQYIYSTIDGDKGMQYASEAGIKEAVGDFETARKLGTLTRTRKATCPDLLDLINKDYPPQQ